MRCRVYEGAHLLGGMLAGGRTPRSRVAPVAPHYPPNTLHKPNSTQRCSSNFYTLPVLRNLKIGAGTCLFVMICGGLLHWRPNVGKASPQDALRAADGLPGRLRSFQLPDVAGLPRYRSANRYS